MFQKMKLLIAILTLSTSAFCFADDAWTNVDCGGVNETLQATQPYPAGTTKLDYAEYITLILGNKLRYGWPEGRPMPSNLYIGGDIASVEPLSAPKGVAAAYYITITSKNHYPATRVVCTFTEMQAK